MTYTDFYQPGVPAQIETVTTSLVELCATAVKQGKDRVALDFFGRTTTYRSLGDQIARVAEGLRRLGVVAGDRVALVLPNCPQHVIAFHAILRLGAIVVEHNPLYTARELRHMFEDHAARVAICWDVAVDKLRQQPGDIELDHIISVNLLDEFPLTKRLALKLPLPGLRATRKRLTTPVKHTIEWRSLLDHHRLSPAHPAPTANDIAVIQYTSGTTGLPKGAILTHANIYANARQSDAWMKGARTGQEVFFAILPFFHALGMMVFLGYALMKQARIRIFPTFDLDLVMAAAKKQPPTVLCAVPPIFEAMAKAAKKRHISLRATKFALSGAMALTPEITALWESVSGGPLIEGYGLTEASPIALGNPLHSTRRPGTIGLPFPSTEIKVVSLNDQRQTVALGERGELLIRGPQVFQGYWNNPAETDQILLPGGWLTTGDIVTQDADGFTTIVDRKKELIITGGFNVSPTEVEIVVRAHPGVADVAVVGLPHSHSGEMVVAAVVPDPGATLTEDEVRHFCRARLAAYKVPRRVFLVESLPKSILGKVLRAEVRQELQSRHH